MATAWHLRLSAAACAIGAALAFAPSAQALQLITAREAALPAAPGGYERGISRGPTIVVISPAPDAGTVRSPIELKIKFIGHGGAKIDVSSVLLTYMKRPRVDLTRRIKPFISATGIDVEDAEVPPGAHWLRVDIADTNGRAGWADFTFKVSQ
jgi:hypothetical protein